MRFAGIADAGPIQPLLANLDSAVEPPVRAAAQALHRENDTFRSRKAA
jgi:hypothetical protein